MSVYLLDTNIIALFDPRHREQAGPLIDWMRRNDRFLFLSTVTLIEIEAGILNLLREGKDKRAGEIAAMREGLINDFRERLVAMDAMVALTVARIGEMARPMDIERKDLIIAATARIHGLTVLTRNLRHFLPTGVAAVDPLVALPSDGTR
jgi:predicted nucleic acid-binding protein